MNTFKELYDQTLRQALTDDFESIASDPDYDAQQLSCLLNPEKQPLVIRTGVCDCSPDERHACVDSCPFGAISSTEGGSVEIDSKLCLGCCDCIAGCKRENLAPNTDVYPALKAIRRSPGLTYALVAPAFLGQFGEDVTPGRLRSALKAVGFDGMIEVALFADILTLKEALEFNENIQKEGDYQLTSCCCPMWIAMIRKIYSQLVPHVPGSVSPMIACARTIKKLYPDAVTVFIGPCLAKKAEAREKDLAGDVDFVLTFQEMESIFRLLGIQPGTFEEDDKDHASRAGRIYARAGGVSEAVAATAERLQPGRTIRVKTVKADGVPACKAMIKDILSGDVRGNFYEGMGCKGGCVGGPRSVVPAEVGAKAVNAYGELSPYQTPAENPYVIELLHRLGFETVEDLLEKSDIFTRTF
ncbi:MAG: iron hydrogenase [Clostridiales bacterium]|nr:iron hydrogenase [Clostridiales bacterium]